MEPTVERCCANLNYLTGDESSRCVRGCISGSKHCIEHNPMAVKIYNSYKRTCKSLDKVNKDVVLKSNDCAKITSYYALLHRAYMGRLEHRKYAFVPECYDRGHLYQLKKLNSLMLECEKVLSEMYESDKSVADVMIEDEANDSENSDSNNYNISSNINTLKDDRLKKEEDVRIKYKSFLDDEKNVNSLMQSYIDENTKKKEYKLSIVKLMVKTHKNMLLQLVIDSSMLSDTVELVFFTGLFNIIVTLISIGYFDGNYVGTQDKISIDLFTNIFRNTHSRKNTTMFELYGRYDVSVLKNVCEKMILARERFYPIFCDLSTRLQDQNLRQIMDTRYYLVWHDGAKRLVLYADYGVGIRLRDPTQRILHKIAKELITTHASQIEEEMKKVMAERKER